MGVRAFNPLQNKLHPVRFTCISNRLVFLVGGIVGADWVRLNGQPCREIAITSDGWVLGNGELVGSAADFERNLSALLKLANLTEPEMAEFRRLYRERVVDYRPPVVVKVQPA